MSATRQLVVRLATNDQAHRDECVKRLQGVADGALADEPGTKKYAVLVPRDAEEKGNWEVFVLEEYADEAALGAHQGGAHAGALMAWGAEAPGPKAPEMHLLQLPADSFGFSDAALAGNKDPFVVVGDYTLKAGTADQTLPSWQAIVDSAKGEDGTILYWVAKEQAQADHIWTVSAHVDEAQLQGVHLKSQAVADGLKATQDLGTNVEWINLKLVGGFFSR